MLKLGKGISQLLPYAFWSGKYMRGGGCSQCYWNMKLSHPTSLLCLSLTSLSFKVYLHPSLLPLIPHLPILLARLHPLHPSVLYLAFCLTISCHLLFSHLFFHLRLTLYRSSFPSIVISSPLPPQPNAFLHFLLQLPLSPHLQQCRTFSISALLFTNQWLNLS